MFTQKHVIIKRSPFEILLNLDINPIPNKGSVQIRSTEKLLEIVYYAGIITYAINENSLQFILYLLEQSLLLKSFGPATIRYLDTMYRLDFNAFITNNTNSATKQIIADLNINGLYNKCKSHEGFSRSVS